MNFAIFLHDEHTQKYPELLDDSLPDHFDEWISNMESDEWIKLAEEYGLKKSVYKVDNLIKELTG
jgi:hypothetical protein